MKIFLSHCFDDRVFIHQVADHLGRYPEVEVFCFIDAISAEEDFPEKIGKALAGCSAFILFLGGRIGDTQKQEVLAAARLERQASLIRAAVDLPDCAEMPAAWMFPQPHLLVSDLSSAGASTCADAIMGAIRSSRNPCGVPAGYMFSYEKHIFEIYAKAGGRMGAHNVELGAPETWPAVKRDAAALPNLVSVDEIGSRRDDDAHIIVDARTRFPLDRNGPMGPALTFPEAGPRNMLSYPRPGAGALDVGIIVSGGIAPGIGAVISGIVERHCLYHQHPAPGTPYELHVWGYRDGFSALAAGNQKIELLTLRRHHDAHGIPHRDRVDQQLSHLRHAATLGGAQITTARFPDLMRDGVLNLDLLDTMVRTLTKDRIDILYVIGGEGSIRAAHCLWERARSQGSALSVCAIPKTMDNDILWVWQSFGFLSAVEKAKELVLQLHTEARSNPRLCVVQLFGSDSGFVAAHTAHACGVCDLVLIPEEDPPFRLDSAFTHLTRVLDERLVIAQHGQSPYGLVIMSETAIPEDYEDYLATPGYELTEREMNAVKKFVVDDNRRLHGTTPDELRRGSLKIVAGGLQHLIRTRMPAVADYWRTFRVFTNEPRHLIRTTAPSVSDVISGERLGVLAADNAMAGYTDFMISQWLTEYVLVPLPLVVLGRKRLPTTGIFWKSVIANTGQPGRLGRLPPAGEGHSLSR